MKQLILAFFCIWVASPGYSQQTFSLSEAIDYALLNHNDLKQDQLDLQDATGQVKEFTSIGIPQVRGSIQYQYYIDIPTNVIEADAFGFPDYLNTFLAEVGEKTNTPLNAPEPTSELQELQFGTQHNIIAGLEASAMIFDGSFFVGLKAARLYKELVKKQADLTKSELRVNVTKAYLAVLISKESQEIIAKDIANITKSYEETKAIYESGFAEKLDVDRLKLSLRNLEAGAENIERQVNLSLNLLKFQMGYPMLDAIEVSDEFDQLVEDAVAQQVALTEDYNVQNRIEYQTLVKAEEVNQMNVNRWKVAYIPSLFAIGSYQQQMFTNDLSRGRWFPATFVGAELSVPIFDGFEKEAKIQRAKVDVAEIQLQMSDFKRLMDFEVRNARISYVNALQSVETRKESIELAENIYDVTQIKYKEGVGSSVELSQAERELYSAQSNYIDALYELLIAKTDLDKALGKI